MLFRNFTATAVTLLAVLLTAGLADAAIFSIQFGPNLYVIGDDGNDDCSINVETDSGIIDVSGSDQNYSVEDISRIIVWTYGGDDRVVISQSSSLFTASALEGELELPLIDVDVITSWGDDSVSITGAWGSTRVLMGFGSDSVFIGSVVTGAGELVPGSLRDLYIDTGFDDDHVTLGNVVVGFQVASGSGFSWSQIYTGSGNDRVLFDGYLTVPSMNGFDVRTVLATGAGDDQVIFGGSLVPFDYFDGGFGFDRLGLDLHDGSASADEAFFFNFEADIELE